MNDDRGETRRRIARVMFVVAAVLITIPLCLAAFQACQSARIVSSPPATVQPIG